MPFRLVGFALLIWAGYSLCSSEYGKTRNWFKTWMTGAGICLFFAVGALITMGSPSCDEYEDDGYRGSTCLEYADDGYIATYQQRFERFITVFGTMTAAGSASMLIYFQNYKRQSNKLGNLDWKPEQFKNTKNCFLTQQQIEKLLEDSEEYQKKLLLERYRNGITDSYIEYHSLSKEEFQKLPLSAVISFELFKMDILDQRKRFDKDYSIELIVEQLEKSRKEFSSDWVAEKLKNDPYWVFNQIDIDRWKNLENFNN